MTEGIRHSFKFRTKWDGGRNDYSEFVSGNLKNFMSIPKEMDGPGIGTNPDELLLSAAAGCYIISLATMLDLSKVKAELLLESVGNVQVENNRFTYKAIHHFIEIYLEDYTPSHIRIANRLAIKAEENCMISRALRGNVEISVSCVVKEKGYKNK